MHTCMIFFRLFDEKDIYFKRKNSFRISYHFLSSHILVVFGLGTLSRGSIWRSTCKKTLLHMYIKYTNLETMSQELWNGQTQMTKLNISSNEKKSWASISIILSCKFICVCVMSKHNIIIFWLSRSITLQHIPFPCFIFRDLKTKNIDLQFYNMQLVNGINSARTFRIFMFADFTYYLFENNNKNEISLYFFKMCKNMVQLVEHSSCKCEMCICKQ